MIPGSRSPIGDHDGVNADPVRAVIDQTVDQVPGLVGAVVGTSDGFVLASRLGDGAGNDASSVAAMSAATLGLSSRLTNTVAPGAAAVAEFSSDEARVFVFSISGAATLTFLAESSCDRPQVIAVGRELVDGLRRLLSATPGS